MGRSDALFNMPGVPSSRHGCPPGAPRHCQRTLLYQASFCLYGERVAVPFPNSRCVVAVGHHYRIWIVWPITWVAATALRARAAFRIIPMLSLDHPPTHHDLLRAPHSQTPVFRVSLQSPKDESRREACPRSEPVSAITPWPLTSRPLSQRASHTTLANMGTPYRALFVKNLRLVSPHMDRRTSSANVPCSFNVSAEELFDLFGKFGPVRYVTSVAMLSPAIRVQIADLCSQIRQGIASNTKGTAFVVYEDVMDAKQACDKLNGFNFQNRYLVGMASSSRIRGAELTGHSTIPSAR